MDVVWLETCALDMGLGLIDAKDSRVLHFTLRLGHDVHGAQYDHTLS
jgi:hypothetical protein